MRKLLKRKGYPKSKINLYSHGLLDLKPKCIFINSYFKLATLLLLSFAFELKGDAQNPKINPRSYELLHLKPTTNVFYLKLGKNALFCNKKKKKKKKTTFIY